MKRIFLFFSSIVLCMTIQATAQNIWLRGGGNMSNVSIKVDGQKESEGIGPIVGFHVGATVEFPLIERLSIETGLLLDSRGFKGNVTDQNFSIEVQERLYYADVPLFLKVPLLEKKNFSVHVLGGGYAGVGLFGNIKGSVFGNATSEKVVWGGDEDLKRLDAGYLFGAGVELNNKFQINAIIKNGLLNIVPNDPTNVQTKVNHLGILLSLGYRIGKK